MRGFFCSTVDQFLGLRRKLAIPCFRNQNWAYPQQIVNIGNVLLYFPEFLVTVDGVGVFLTVDNALLQTVKGFRPGKGVGLNAPGTESGQLEFNRRHTNFQSLKVSHLFNGFF